MTPRSFSSVAMAERRARQILPRSVFDTVSGGSEAGTTLKDNVAAFDELGFAPRIAAGASRRELTTTVLGHDVSLPVLIAPTGVHAIHPDGELAVARAAAAHGTLMSLSNVAGRPLEEVVGANRRTLYQLNWNGSRPEIAARIARARDAGAVGLIATLDWSFTHGPDSGTPSIPETVDWRALLRHAPEGLRRPRWLGRYARSGGLPDLRVPNLVARGAPAPTFAQAYTRWQRTPPPTREDVGWLRAQWPGPFLLKGIMRVDDARRAVAIGCDAISVSNHGANNLDGTPASIRALPAIAEAVGGAVEILLDGGIRRGADVVKALALGAQAVMIGRPYLWGLAVGGQRGVERVFEILHEGIDSTLLALGRASIRDLSPGDLLIAAGFPSRLGV